MLVAISSPHCRDRILCQKSCGFTTLPNVRHSSTIALDGHKMALSTFVHTSMFMLLAKVCFPHQQQRAFLCIGVMKTAKSMSTWPLSLVQSSECINSTGCMH